MKEDIHKILAESHLLCLWGKYADAETKSLLALTLLKEEKKNDTVFASALTSLAEIYFHQKRYDESLSMAEEALPIFERQFGKEHSHTAGCLSFIGLSQMKLKRFSLAKEILKDTLRLTKNCFGKTSESYLKALQNLAFVCTAIGDTNESESFLEESMEVYLELVKNNFNTIDYDERVALSDKYFSYQLHIYNYITTTPQCSNEFLKKVFDFRLNTKLLLLEIFDSSMLGSDAFEKIKSTLLTDEVAIEVIRFLEMEERETGNSRYAFLIVSNATGSAPKLVTIYTNPDNEKSEHEVYQRNIQKKSVDLTSYATYWNFLTPELKGNKRIYFSPDGIYRNLNINTLETEEGTSLLDEYEVMYYNDLRNLIARDKERATIPKEALLLANPIFYNEDVYSRDKTIAEFLPQIPESKNEIGTVNKILEDSNCRTHVYCDEAVTKSVFNTVSEFQLLHIATHGYFRKTLQTISKVDELMFHSGLFLSHPFVYSAEHDQMALTEDGYLSSNDIVKMDLSPIDLVVLSACNSGLGIQINSGDTFGFIRTFFTAGAHHLIISLWDVEDKVTHEFMDLFYSCWMQSNDKYSAFRKAQQEIKKKYSHPLYWGGFVLYHR